MEEFIEIPEIIDILHIKSKSPERYVRDWLKTYGITQFHRGGVYVREHVLNAIEERKNRCYSCFISFL